MVSAVQVESHLDPALPDTLIAAPGGELDHTNAEHLRHRVLELLEGGHHHLVLDVGALTFCDSTGIRIFLALRTLITDRGGVIVLSDLASQLERTFAMTGLGSYFTFPPTRGDALALLRTSSPLPWRGLISVRQVEAAPAPAPTCGTFVASDH